MTGVFVVLAVFFLALAVGLAFSGCTDEEYPRRSRMLLMSVVCAACCGGLAWWCR